MGSMATSTAPPKRTPPASSSPQPVPPPQRAHRLRDFWQRVSEGMELNELWQQFKAEARTSYGLYSRELRSKGSEELRGRHRVWHFTKQFFWAVLMKLSPARRIILLAALVLLVLGTTKFSVNGQHLDVQDAGTWAGLLLLLLLILEIADRVTMKRDLEIAKEIQRWLVPQVAPQIPGLDVGFVTRPANTVAGDYYDVFPLDDNGRGSSVLLAVADVAGKSLPAALLMATFQASLRTLSTSAPTLPELMEGLNRYACTNSRDGQRFTTAFVANLNLATGELAYSNAGHNAPLLMRKSGGLERLEAGGVPLGVLPEAPYECAATRLNPGDLLVIFTDGVVEAVSERGEEYQEGRLVAVVNACGGATANEVIQRLMRDLDAFVGYASQHDDITCMVVRRTGVGS
jgi:serine phosphatase RsbU (regulator of sigma subunit)